MNKPDPCLGDVEARFGEWKTRIDLLEAKMAILSLEAKKELLEELGALRLQKAVVREKWNELQKAGGGVRKRMEAGFEKEAFRLKDALDKVFSRFR